MRDNKELIKSFIEEVFNKHDLTAIDKYLVANLTNGSGKKSKEPDYDEDKGQLKEEQEEEIWKITTNQIF